MNPAGSGPLVNVNHIRGGHSHTCARLRGQVRCWGNNDNGQVGDRTDSTDRLLPRVVVV